MSRGSSSSGLLMRWRGFDFDFEGVSGRLLSERGFLLLLLWGGELSEISISESFIVEDCSSESLETSELFDFLFSCKLSSWEPSSELDLDSS